MACYGCISACESIGDAGVYLGAYPAHVVKQFSTHLHRIRELQSGEAHIRCDGCNQEHAGSGPNQYEPR